MPNKEKIKVLFVTHYRELYGANNSLLQLMLELREKGVEPSVMLPSGSVLPDNDLSQQLDTNRIPYTEIKMRSDKHPSRLKVIPNYILALLYRREARKALKDLPQGFDLVHSNTSTVSIGAYLARIMGKPHIWHMREYGDLDYGMRTPFGKWYQRIIYSGHNTFIAISKGIQHHYSRYVGKQPIKLIYNGIKPNFPQRTEQPHDSVRICIVGILRKEKGQLELVEAADVLLNQRGIKNFHITVIGSGDPVYESQLRDYIEQHGLEETVTLAGRRNDVAQMLTTMDVGVMASSHEAFGRVTVEYMMAGLAVVASDGGANTEIIDDRITGLIYGSSDHTALADRLETLITDTDIRKRLAHKGQEAAMRRFASEANSTAVFSLYNEILCKQ